MTFLDTGFLFALVSDRDAHHARVVEVFQTFKGLRLAEHRLTARKLRPRSSLIDELYARYTSFMTLRRRVKRVGGSLGILLPRDFAAAMNVKAGSEVRLTLVGNQVVVEPAADSLDDGAFRRAFAAVLRRHRRAFGLLAGYDRGGWQPSSR